MTKMIFSQDDVIERKHITLGYKKVEFELEDKKCINVFEEITTNEYIQTYSHI